VPIGHGVVLFDTRARHDGADQMREFSLILDIITDEMQVLKKK
jgi:hypothetical protein